MEWILMWQQHVTVKFPNNKFVRSRTKGEPRQSVWFEIWRVCMGVLPSSCFKQNIGDDVAIFLRTTKYSNWGKCTFILRKNINIILVFCFKYELRNTPTQTLQISNRTDCLGPPCSNWTKVTVVFSVIPITIQLKTKTDYHARLIRPLNLTESDQELVWDGNPSLNGRTKSCSCTRFYCVSFYFSRRFMRLKRFYSAGHLAVLSEL